MHGELNFEEGGFSVLLDYEPGGPGNTWGGFRSSQDRVSYRLLVDGDHQYCAGPTSDGRPISGNFPSRPAGAVGLAVRDGRVTFQRLDLWAIPDQCNPDPVAPAPP